MTDTKLFHIISHPSASEVGRQMGAFEGSEERYGEYIVRSDGAAVESQSAADSEPLLQTLRIAPERLKRGESVGAFAVLGYTEDDEHAFVDITPGPDSQKGRIITGKINAAILDSFCE